MQEERTTDFFVSRHAQHVHLPWTAAIDARLEMARREAAELESTFVEKLKVAEREAAEASKALEQSGIRVAELETTLGGVEQMLVIKDEEVGELQIAHSAELAQQHAQALALRRHDQRILFFTALQPVVLPVQIERDIYTYILAYYKRTTQYLLLCLGRRALGE